MSRHEREKAIIKSRNSMRNTIGNRSSIEPLQEEKEETGSAMTQNEGIPLDVLAELFL